MRILQCLFIFTVFIPITWMSAADETICVSLYYPYGYVWVGPYQVVPVLYVVPVSLKIAQPKRLTTPAPLMTPSTPSGPVTTEPPTTTTSRRGDN